MPYEARDQRGGGTQRTAARPDTAPEGQSDSYCCRAAGCMTIIPGGVGARPDGSKGGSIDRRRRVRDQWWEEARGCGEHADHPGDAQLEAGLF